jgi:hypothetical protein
MPLEYKYYSFTKDSDAVGNKSKKRLEFTRDQGDIPESLVNVLADQNGLASGIRHSGNPDDGLDSEVLDARLLNFMNMGVDTHATALNGGDCQ